MPTSSTMATTASPSPGSRASRRSTPTSSSFAAGCRSTRRSRPRACCTSWSCGTFRSGPPCAGGRPARAAESLLHKLELRHLLERLPFDRVLPEIKVQFSDVADYRRLATFIESHGFRLSQLWRRYVSVEEALGDWYEYGYRPIAEMIREERILDAFPGRTEMDLYLWIVNHRERLALEARDERISPRAAKDDILKQGRRRS